MNIRRHDADLALTGRDNTRAIGPNQPDTQLIAFDLCLEHIERRDALGDTDDEFNACIGRLKDRVFTKGRGDIDHGGLRLGFRNSLGHGIEHWQIQVRLTSLAGGHAANHLGTVRDRLLRMESALRAGETLADYTGILIDQDTHDAPPAAATTF